LHDLWFLKHLDRFGHDILSVRVYKSPGAPDYAPDLAAFPRVRHREASHWFGESRAAGETPELGMARRLRRLLQEYRPDILQSGWLSDGGVLAALTGFKPLVMTPFGSDVLINPYRSPEHRWKARLALRCVEAVTTDALEVAERISQLSGFPRDRIVRFPWGIDLTRFRSDAPPADLREQLGWEGKTVLVATRSLEPVYGTQFLIEALPLIHRVRPDVALLVVGDGSQRHSLEGWVANLGLGKSVHFAGQVPNEALPGHLTASDLYVTAALSDGTSRSLMEAYACGLPVVVTDPPAYREWVQEGIHGTIVRKGDPGPLAEGILRLLTEPDALPRMREAVLAVARERFDELKNIAKLEGIYAEALKGGPPPELKRAEALPSLDLASVRHAPSRYPSFKARLSEWLVIAALYGEARARRSPGWPGWLRWR
jgi:glycosyltransferase involved in cell wall biosynthesis